ncbi:MAG: hypothetical protein CME65_07630 [Halobacteriovoraceae bacterium]|nr:hypothetical protein [Halobacteriovoraceae bacterium]|tara:strand:+ start:5980 stop:7092 length:1113 start_codon:yes stop_codon:yes gene_type:complete
MLKEFTVFLKIENLASEEVHKRKYLVQPGKPLFLGRSKECHIVLIDENVSRRHACLKVDGDQLTIKDLKSGNGTFVNGEKISAFNINEGQMIVLGGFEVSVMKLVGAPSKVMPDDIIIEEDIKDDFSKNAHSDSPASDSESKEKGAQISSDNLDAWQGKMSVDGFKNIFVETWKLFIEQKLEFFKKIQVNGSVKNSLIVISVSSFIPSLLTLLLSSSESLEVILNNLITLLFTIASVYLTAKIMDMMKNWLRLEGSFENFLRFYAIGSLISLPLSLLTFVPVLGGFIAIISFAIAILFLYGFYVRFRPMLKRFIIACLVVLGLQITLQVGVYLITAAQTVSSAESEAKDSNIFKKMKGDRKKLEEAFEAN